MMVPMLVVVVVPGILINVWLTRREKAKKRRGFEVITGGSSPVLQENETTGAKARVD